MPATAPGRRISDRYSSPLPDTAESFVFWPKPHCDHDEVFDFWDFHKQQDTMPCFFASGTVNVTGNKSPSDVHGHHLIMSPALSNLTGNIDFCVALAIRQIIETPDSEIQKAYRERIEQLRMYGAEEDVAINPKSEEDLWTFINSHPDWRKGLTELINNGNLRAVWKDGAGNHLGLQFLGQQGAEYAIFKTRPDTGDVLREGGIDTFDGIDRRVNDLDLIPLVRP